MPAPLLAALRFPLATLALWVALAIRRRWATTWSLPPRGDTLRLLSLGVFGVAASGLLGYWGISLTTATDAALLIVGEVLFTTLLAVMVGGEVLGVVRGIGLATGGVGIVVLIVGGATADLVSAPARPPGDALILVGLACEALFTVLGNRLGQRYDPLTVLTLSFTGSCLVWLPVLGWYAVHQAFTPLDGSLGLGVLYLALVNGVVCYLIWFGVLRRVGATAGGGSRCWRNPWRGLPWASWCSATLSCRLRSSAAPVCSCPCSSRRSARGYIGADLEGGIDHTGMTVATRPRPSASPGRILARVLTELFAPAVVAGALLILVAFHSTTGVSEAVHWAGLAVLFAARCW